MKENERFMRMALTMAERAKKKDEVPVGAVIVQNGKVLAHACNMREKNKNPMAHAEILAIQKAAKKLGGWRLPNCSIYVTLEPCPMCAGAIINARIDNVYFGAYDSKAGAFGSLYNLSEGKLNHTPSVTGGILEQECASILSNYFKAKRNRTNLTL
jgi:tRNA(adenine34) deaminase